MLPEASVTPAVAMPVSMWITISIGMVSAWRSGKVVNAHAKMQPMNSGAHTRSTALLLSRSAMSPQRRSTARFMS
jgi:hypothetical protein